MAVFPRTPAEIFRDKEFKQTWMETGLAGNERYGSSLNGTMVLDSYDSYFIPRLSTVMILTKAFDSYEHVRIYICPIKLVFLDSPKPKIQ